MSLTVFNCVEDDSGGDAKCVHGDDFVRCEQVQPFRVAGPSRRQCQLLRASHHVFFHRQLALL